MFFHFVFFSPILLMCSRKHASKDNIVTKEQKNVLVISASITCDVNLHTHNIKSLCLHEDKVKVWSRRENIAQGLYYIYILQILDTMGTGL